MGSWLILLAGLIIWAVHFFLMYGIGEFGGDGDGARATVLAITFLCVTANGGLMAALLRTRTANEYELWRNRSALIGILLSIIAIIWQGLPALF